MARAFRTLALIAASALSLTACPAPPTVTPPPTELPKVESKVAAATRVISKNAPLQSFTVLNADACLKLEVANALRPKCLARFVFPTGDATLATLSVGSVMVGEPSAKAPSGFLMRATAINPQGVSTEVLATEAAFGDAFEQGEAEFDVKLRPDQVSSATALVPGLRFSNGASQYNKSEVNVQGGLVKPLGVFDFNFNSVVYDDDGNTSTTTDQVRASGSFNFETGDGISAGLKWKKVWGVPIYPNGVYFKVAYGIKSRANVNLTMDINKTIKKEIELARYNFDPITVFVGPVPLVFIPQVIITLDTEGKIAAKTTFSASAKFDAYGCLEYNSGFNNCSSFGQDFSAGLGGVNASLKARATLNVKGNILLYGIVGPYVRAGAYLELEAVVPRNPVWTLTAGAVAGLGLHVDLGIKTLDYDVEFFNKSFGQIAQAENSAPFVKSIAVGNGVSLTGLGILQNESKEICVLTGDLEDGEKLAVSVTVTGKGNFQIAKGAFCTAPIKWNQEGLQNVTATTTDSQGKVSAPKTFSFSVVNAPPDIFVKFPNEAQTVTVDSDFTLVGGWLDGNETLDCSKVAWSITVNDLPSGAVKLNSAPTPSNGCGNPTGRVNADKVGANKVTLTVTDSSGKRTALSRTVNAIAKPIAYNAPPQGWIDAPKSIPVIGGGVSDPYFLTTDTIDLEGSVLDEDNSSVNVKWTVTQLSSNFSVVISNEKFAITPKVLTKLPKLSFTIREKFGNACDGGYNYRITLEVTDGQSHSDSPAPVQQSFGRFPCPPK